MRPEPQPRLLLLPAMALHGYVLSASVLGWSAMPVMTYLSGLLISQGSLLLLALWWIQPLASRLQRHGRAAVVAALIHEVVAGGGVGEGDAASLAASTACCVQAWRGWGAWVQFQLKWCWQLAHLSLDGFGGSRSSCQPAHVPEKVEEKACTSVLCCCADSLA